MSILDKPVTGSNRSVLWDGSCLGDWNQVKIHQKMKDGQSIYYQLGINGQTVVAKIKQASSSYICLVDEMKSYFRLPKQGTHWFRHGNSVKIMIRTPFQTRLNQIQIINYPSLTKFKRSFIADLPSHSNWKRKFQEKYPGLPDRIGITFTFRFIFGTKIMNQSSIIIKWENIMAKGNKADYSQGDIPVDWIDSSGWNWYPMSIDETIEERDSQIPESVRKDWFDRKEIDQVAKEMCRIREYQHLQRFLLKTQTKLESVVKRVDGNLIIYITDIIRRLTKLISDCDLIDSNQILPPNELETSSKEYLIHLKPIFKE